jgi:hypothetical protein
MQPAQPNQDHQDPSTGLFYDQSNSCWYALDPATGQRYYYQPQPEAVEEPEPELPSEDTPNKAEALAKYWDIRGYTERTLAKAGFTAVRKPEYTYPAINPRALQASSHEEVGEIHARIGGWLNYADYTLADVESHLMAIDREMSQLLAYLLDEIGVEINQSTGKPYSVADRTAKAERAPRYQELLKEKTKLEASKVKLKSWVKSFERDSAMVSRHITLRVNAMSHDNAARGIPNRGMARNQPVQNWGR